MLDPAYVLFNITRAEFRNGDDDFGSLRCIPFSRRPEDKARKAAEAIASHENRFSSTDLVVLKWMTGTILAGVAALVIKSFVS